jgi:hypothetical protein
MGLLEGIRRWRIVRSRLGPPRSLKLFNFFNLQRYIPEFTRKIRTSFSGRTQETILRVLKPAPEHSHSLIGKCRVSSGKEQRPGRAELKRLTSDRIWGE